MNSIIANYKHEFTTEFIIENSNDSEGLKKLDLSSYERIFFVCDKNVYSIYGEKITSILKSKNKEVKKFLVQPEEKSKSIAFYPELIDFLEMNNTGRYDVVVAMGGGIIIDLVSFTVSSYMRGLPLYLIPTTLIGQTDASTAGKTCLNTRNTKNLLGTFYYPIKVYNNLYFLKTNTNRILRQGLSESFKYGLLNSEELVNKVIEYQNGKEEVMNYIVSETIKSRIAIRQIDPLASNLGHTFGHALEKYFNYDILHGDAISIGTVFAIYFAKKMKIISDTECNRVFQKMKEAKLNIFICKDLDVVKLLQFMKKDKKSSPSFLHLVLIEKITKPYKKESCFFETDYKKVEIFLKEFLESYKYKIDNYCEFLKKEILF